ncbi:MAG: hypothetical protein J7J91_02650 [Deltaproteobacteria bacterium]|nr:hypothetical protein [Deltaproteobacteria bacterium]MCD6137476.1 hypothetical protein [Deltaproteobacteria bacterium]
MEAVQIPDVGSLTISKFRLMTATLILSVTADFLAAGRCWFLKWPVHKQKISIFPALPRQLAGEDWHTV